jgi:TRAP-type transport system periplasmic protein
MRALALLLLALLTADARAAEPRSLKLAAISPDGTLWSRELRTTAQEIEAKTDGAVRIKLYLGAVAGDET